MKEYKHCTLCPRGCGVDRTAGQRGVCGASDEIRVGRAALHQWEEPPISGTRGSGTVFFVHCPLGCVFCQNRAISRRGEGGKVVTVPQLMQTFLKLQEQGAHNINLVTATHYVPSVARALEQARAHGLVIPVVYNTSGYETVETLRRLDGLVQIYLPDFKYYSSYYAQRYSHASDYPDIVRDAIDEMVRQTGAPRFDTDGLLTRGTVIRHLILPELSGDTAQVLRCIAERWGDMVLVSLMRQYTPFDMQAFPELNRCITDTEYEQAVEWFSDLGLAGFLQDGQSIGESFIPEFDGQGV